MSTKTVSSICSLLCLTVVISLVMSFAGLQNCAIAKANDTFFDNIILAGNLYLKGGDYEKALHEFLKAEENDSKNPDVLIGLIRSYSKLGEFDKAWSKLKFFNKKYPYDMRYHLVKGEHLSLKGHTEESAAEFTTLIEKGIYRFEALQGLIRIYALTNEEQYISVIENTIPLYESPNQIVLYELLSSCLEENGKNHEAEEYRTIANALDSSPSISSKNKQLSSTSLEIEQALEEAHQLMECGSLKAAEELLANSARKWPSETRFHTMLKDCYMKMLDDTPMITGTDNPASVSSALGFSPMQGQKGSELLKELIPEDGMLPVETVAYLEKIIDISSKTENYFLKVYVNIQKLNQRVQSDLSRNMSKKESDRVFNQHVKEFRVILKECSTVCKMEIDALEKINPPANFSEFHEYFTETTRLFDQVFVKLNDFATTWNWNSYTSAMNLLNSSKLRIDKQVKMLENAISNEMIGMEPDS